MLRRNGQTRSGSVVQAADQFVAKLGFPAAATWDDLQSSVEKVYGKPVYLIASASTALKTVTGLWIDTAEFGTIVCRESDELHYQSQNACHELAHILFAYAPDAWFSEQIPRLIHPDRRHGAAHLCAPTDDPDSSEAKAETAIEQIAFAMVRRIQTLNRTSEETYFG
ncbi:hypothetical protein [Rathayibacter iranicus]|uniref:IrrE N-terminal-like domain-containing protein n=2 Tax=Rathayibacter iranicus TaxID=59737 RepID=A0AAD1AHS9_9MICO|nr:hypothetical protein [Rathayibacter iranicus]AZZ56949.1 hypothetical protein C7V51_14465 [Rathayibacter iranicus]MWV29550.1 hypothetical protein [Rathayibacter iranicus NCPPB 2253 = VKM Ac-1602]PPI41873.1 hypothetical protein C5E09_13320 [Rathayibacter iranicus]PPI57613.1 hypothetical protein C5E08_14220 [Rathayibacter iranicus]PPI68593.1 hypothetical protein C5E01_13275 [Rathayibacter iranicus]